MKQSNNQPQHNIQNIDGSRFPIDSLKAMMASNIHDAKTILEVSKTNGYIDSQEFIDWQDMLNAISVTYE